MLKLFQRKKNYRMQETARRPTPNFGSLRSQATPSFVGAVRYDLAPEDAPDAVSHVRAFLTPSPRRVP